MWLILPLSLFLLFVDPSTSCCCKLSYKYPRCKCNIFGCKYETEDGGYCKREYKVDAVRWGKKVKRRVCKSSKNNGHAEWCPGRRRMKRSLAATISQAYGELYSQMHQRPAMHHFFTFDLNRDGRISLEEAMLTTNGTKEEFNLVDDPSRSINQLLLQLFLEVPALP